MSYFDPSCVDNSTHRTPGVLQDVQANGATGRRDVRVVDFCDELHLEWLKGVSIGHLDVNVEGSILVRAAFWTWKCSYEVEG